MGSVQVLVCDDDAAMRAKFRRILEEIGDTHVEELERPEDVTTKLRKMTRPALLVMDLCFPERPGDHRVVPLGHKYLEAVRKEFPGTKILVATTIGGDAYSIVLECEARKLHDAWIDFSRETSADEFRTRVTALLYPAGPVSMRGLWAIQLSDLHFGRSSEYRYLGNAEDGVLLEQLSEDLESRLPNDCPKFQGVDLVFLVGDAADRARPGEYRKVEELLAGLRAVLERNNGGREVELVAVPGNHDFNWDISRARCVSVGEKGEMSVSNVSKVSEIPESLAYIEQYAWAPFADFVESAGVAVPRASDLWKKEKGFEGAVWSFPRLGATVVGFNSTGRRENHIERKPEIRLESIRGLQKTAQPTLKEASLLPRIALVHHPLGAWGSEQPGGEHIRDVRTAIYKRFDTSIILSGHVHEGVVETVTVEDRALLVVGSGSASGAKTAGEEKSLGYNIIGLWPAVSATGAPARAVVYPRVLVEKSFSAHPRKPCVVHEWDENAGWIRRHAG